MSIQSLTFSFNLVKDGISGKMSFLYPTETIVSPAFNAHIENRDNPSINFGIEGVIVDFIRVESKKVIYYGQINPKKINLPFIDNKLQRVWDALGDNLTYERIFNSAQSLETIRQELKRIESLAQALRHSQMLLEADNTVVIDT